MKPVYRGHFHYISVASQLEMYNAVSLWSVKTVKYIVIHCKQTQNKDHVVHMALTRMNTSTYSWNPCNTRTLITALCYETESEEIISNLIKNRNFTQENY